MPEPMAKVAKCGPVGRVVPRRAIVSDGDQLRLPKHLQVPRDRRLCLVDIGDQFKDNAKDLPEQIKDMDVGNTVEDVD